jgi:hypothetical protein
MWRKIIWFCDTVTFRSTNNWVTQSTVDVGWTKNCNKSGLSSGEGLIWAVRDPIEKKEPIKRKGGCVEGYQTVIEDHGVEDKRLQVIEEEFQNS